MFALLCSVAETAKSAKSEPEITVESIQIRKPILKKTEEVVVIEKVN